MFRLSFKQQVLTGFAITLIFVFISAFFSYLSIKSLTESSSWVEHTYKVINTAEKVRLALVDAETDQRGYIITQYEQHKTSFNSSVDEIENNLNALRPLVQDNAAQAKKLDSLAYYANIKLRYMNEVMAVITNRGFDAAKDEIKKNRGQIYKVKFFEQSDAFIANETSLLAVRKEENARDSRKTIIVVLASSLLIFSLVLFLLGYIRRTFDQQKETERQILLNNEELATLSATNEHHNWLLSGAAEVNEALQGQKEIQMLSENIISKISNYIDASIGALFLFDEKTKLFELTGAYAYKPEHKTTFNLGEGLVGQVAASQLSKLIDHVPDNYLKISSGLGHVSPPFLYLAPIIFENTTIAVIELGFLAKPQESKLQLINNISENIGIALNSALAHLQLRDLFEQTQQQAEELESQQEELRTTNEELTRRTEELQASEEELRVQQEELQQTNVELEEKAQLLEEQNVLINEAREAISAKAEELELSSKYKSEFLANMSHELRTPLNSILILARILRDNKQNNLTEDQIKYAGVIQNAGNDLLNLINDILDLSKIETGNIELHLESIKPVQVSNNMVSLFTELARHKKISFGIDLAENLPKNFISDQGRLEQILKNLLSNAFKFTPEDGNIHLNIAVVSSADARNQQLRESGSQIISFKVRDSGIGIAKDKQQVIFEAFKQEDGSTSRKFGGTGLGLSISKELATLLGGEIQIESEQGLGSTFTLLIPLNLIVHAIENPAEVTEAPTVNIPIQTRASLPELRAEESNLLLIIEDDISFAEILKSYAIEKGLEPVLAHTGDQGLNMAIDLVPAAIILDLMLPVLDGWDVLKQLKSNPRTKHIPVHLMSADTEKAHFAEKEGAISFLKKPIDKDKLDEIFDQLRPDSQYAFNNVLVVEDQVLQSNVLTSQLIERGIMVSQAYTGKEALLLLENQQFDCIILDLNLPDISGLALLDKIKTQEKFAHIPVVINTAMELDREQMLRIMRYSEAMVLKTDKSNDRLLDEVSLFIHKLQKSDSSNLPYVSTKEKKNRAANTLEKALKDKTILITDDDMRNIFALSTALEAYDIKILIASNGVEALEKLHDHPNINLVLMDIMMPEMDGYEAMRKIRSNKQYANLPIIALTAKAMKNDKEKCIEAGANDYISKPVDIDKLLSMLRVWLS